MRIVTAASCIVCAVLIAGCGKPSPNAGTNEDQQGTSDQQTAAQLSAQHERDAATDEQQRLLTLKQAAAAATPVPAPPEAPLPTEVAAAPAPEVAATPPAQDGSYQQFYDELSPYGNWAQLPDYGYVFQPTATAQNSNWRPYTLGHWVYTDAGWTWVSSEPFGWITYHYGRWMRTHTLGWVWVPGNDWAPAWVSWRYGNDFVGWAPLPPDATFDPSTGIQQWADQQYSLGPDDYVFVPAVDFGEEDMSAVAEPLADNTPIYDDSNNETNIYYDTQSYIIVCYGPSYEFIRAKSHRPLLPPLAIRRGGFPGAGKFGGATLSGTTLSLNAPRIAGGGKAAPKKLRGGVSDGRLSSPGRPTASNGYAAPPPNYPEVPRPPQQPIAGNRPEPHGTPPRFGQSTPSPTPDSAAGETAPPVIISQQTQQGREENPPSQLPGRGYPQPRQPQQGEPGNGQVPQPRNDEQARQEQILREQQAQQAQQAAQEKAAEQRQAGEQARAVEQARQAQDARAQEAARAESAAREQAAQSAAREQSAQAARAAGQSQQPSSAPSGSQPPTGKNQ
jgi:hypothetical protein